MQNSESDRYDPAEFDMPGHGDWEQGEPEIMVTDGPCENTMNPTKDATYKFLAKFLKEVTSIFPDEYLFLGMIILQIR